ncbi:MAG: hypothetical protein JWM86_2726 [Thermoleophilia bacterium]|nr:hypothetical protein [Thermoleophilia bacterium]
MITAAGMMKPLPVRPVDGTRAIGNTAPLPYPTTTGRTMRPLPMPRPADAPDFVDAIRDAAFQRMLVRLGVQQPLPVVDPTA